MVEEEAGVEDEMKVKRARRRERVVNMGVEKRNGGTDREAVL